LDYLQSLSDEPSTRPESGCFLCEAAEAEFTDSEFEQRLILLRDERGMLLLNRYPYTNGHLLVAPATHVADLSDLNASQRAGLMELAELGNRLLRRAIHCQGVNIGMNLGHAAGAGVPGHLHLHIVPRWHGDTNFMQVVGEVRVIPQALEQSYATLRQALADL
jgi:ATP adenylyltransferase